MASKWRESAETKRQATLGLIPPEWRLSSIPSVEEQKDVTGAYVEQFLDAVEIIITETDALGIASKVASGEWSAVAVTRAFCHRAAIAHQLLNCLHEVFFEAALADARALDEFYAQNKRTVGLLHGVPISLKDQFHVKGVETHMGYVGWIGTFEGAVGDPRSTVFESEMVRELRNLGAVLYCKTSVPHSLMSGETVNNIIGYTWNPKNRFLSSGGSSGGEGALIGIRGSPAGFGTDIGGSVRIPAGFNGLYGVRPSVGRLPYEGAANSMDGQNSVLSVVGPIATTAASVRLLMQALLSQSPWLHDPMVVEMPWRSVEEQTIIDIIKGVSGQRLALGVLRHDGTITPQPPVMRALSMVAEALNKAGHQIIDWQPPSHAHGIAITGKSWTYDGGKDVHETLALSGEEIAAQVKMTYGDAVTEQQLASDIAANNVAKRKWQKEYMDYWNSTAQLTSTGRPVDAFVCPLAPYAAARPQKYKYYGYSMFVNGLDYTSVAMPVTNADRAVDVYADGFQALNEQDETVHADYDAEMYDGAHVSVQIVGRRFTEERTLAIAEYIGSLLTT